MGKKIYIEYKDGGVLKNVYSVKLASADGGYGVRREDTGQVVVANNTAVSNPSVGYYEYDLDYIPNVAYDVSWRVQPTKDSGPQFVTDMVGPFVPTGGSIRASADDLGTARQGTMVTFRLMITNFEGQAIDAETISLRIVRDSDGDTAEFDVPEKVTTGFYVYDWCIPKDQPTGRYTVAWTYVVRGETRVENYSVVVATDATNTSIYSGVPLDMRMRLEYMIRYAQRIPVRNEYSQPSPDRRKFRFTFPLWNQTTGCQIFRNKKLVTEGVEVNYFRGEVIFDDELAPQETVFANYNFRWFSDDQLDSFLNNAVQVFNTFPPHSNYNLTQLAIYATRFVPAVLERAATDAIREMMLSLAFQEPQQVFGGAEGSDKAFSRLESLKKNWEEEWKMIFENKKLGPYPRTIAISVPEYTLPGGRSRWFRYLFSTNTG